MIVIDHHRWHQRLNGFGRGVRVETLDRQVEILAGYRGRREVEHADFEVLDRPVEIHSGIQVFLLLLEGVLLVFELLFKGVAPGFLLLHFCQLFLVEGNLRGALVD
ncbi:hypothetical protein D3C73_1187100 [compost metagenome]